MPACYNGHMKDLIIGVIIFLVSGDATTAHDPRGTPPAIHEMQAAHDNACDRAMKDWTPAAGEICLEAADEWAHIAAVQQGTEWQEYDEMQEAMCRIEAGAGYHAERAEKQAFDQIMLAASIAQGVRSTSKDEYIRRAANAVIYAAYKRYPQMFERIK